MPSGSSNTPDTVWDQIQTSDARECWPWNGPTDRHGKPQVSIENQTCRPQRLVYEWSHGDIPAGMWISSTCKSKVCCNPAHLIATAPGNVMGHNRPNAPIRRKLTREDSVMIRGIFWDREGEIEELAAVFGVSKQTIRFILLERMWSNAVSSTKALRSLPLDKDTV